MSYMWHMAVMALKGLGWFFGMWVVYWFAWFMILNILLMILGPRLIKPFKKAVKIGKKTELTVDFWVIFWYGFMTTVVHSILYLLFFR